MTQRQSPTPRAQPKEQRPCKIRPSRVWSMLSQTQQTAVLQEFVTMCQECLLHQEEASYDAYPPLVQHHPNPS
jgi:hypothetical protein